jgi:hypothetical protein
VEGAAAKADFIRWLYVTAEAVTHKSIRATAMCLACRVSLASGSFAQIGMAQIEICKFQIRNFKSVLSH